MPWLREGRGGSARGTLAQGTPRSIGSGRINGSPPRRARLDSPGAPIPEEVRSPFEARFGYDFSKVRIHTGGQAAASARAVDALAYTVGRDIVFGPGQFQPASAEGRRLLAHELRTRSSRERSTKGHRAASGRAAESASGSHVIRPRRCTRGGSLAAGPRVAAPGGGARRRRSVRGRVSILAAAIGSVRSTTSRLAGLRSVPTTGRGCKRPPGTSSACSRSIPCPRSSSSVTQMRWARNRITRSWARTRRGSHAGRPGRDGCTDRDHPGGESGRDAVLVKTEQSEASNRRVQVLFRPTASPLSPTLPDADADTTAGADTPDFRGHLSAVARIVLQAE